MNQPAPKATPGTQHFVAITMRAVDDPQLIMHNHFVITTPPGATQLDLYRYAINQMPKDVRGGVVTNYFVVPNQIPEDVEAP